MRSCVYILCLVLALLWQSRSSFAAEVRKLDKSGSLVSLLFLNKDEWQINDYVCLQRAKNTVACGQVIRAQRRGVIVQLTIELDKLKEKEQLKLVRVEPTQKELASILGIEAKVARKPWDQSHLSVGLVHSLSLWPHLHFEQALTRKFALGFLPNYFSVSVGNGSMKGFGFLGTASYYNKNPYEGLWVMLGGGLDVFSVVAPSGSFSAITASGLANVGWKIRWDNDITLGIGGGGMYFLKHQVEDFQHSGFLINVLTQVGFIF